MTAGAYAVSDKLLNDIREYMVERAGQKFLSFQLTQMFDVNGHVMAKALSMLEREGTITSIERNYGRTRLFYAYTQQELEYRHRPLTIVSKGVYQQGPEWKAVHDRLAEFRDGLQIE